jgi:hypothetical protein
MGHVIPYETNVYVLVDTETDCLSEGLIFLFNSKGYKVTYFSFKKGENGISSL